MLTQLTEILTDEEKALLLKMALLPVKILGVLPVEVVAAAVAELAKRGELSEEDIPTVEDAQAMDALSAKLGVTPLGTTFN